MCVNELCYSVSLLENSEIVERERDERESEVQREMCGSRRRRNECETRVIIKAEERA
jgi:hypothetical protein